MTLELSMYLLGGAMFVLSCLFTVVWKLLREEAKEHGRQLELKASTDRLSELDNRFDKELQSMRENNEKLIDKIQLRHDRDIEAVSAGFREQISGIKEAMAGMERNIIRQIEFMFNSHPRQ
jgi:hypothetical protein